jgi:hypothetical protein
MPEQAITALRWFLVVAAVVSFLQATLLFGLFQRYVFQPWFRLSERRGARVPALLRDPRIHRAWPLFMTVVFVALWWLSGTPAGHNWLRNAR